MDEYTFDDDMDHLDPLVVPILQERKRQKLTQQALADMAGISRRALGQIERGGDCALSTLRNLYTALGIDIEARPHRPPTLDEQVMRNEAEFQSLVESAHRYRKRPGR